MIQKGITRDYLDSLIKERGQKILKRFSQVAVIGVTDPKLLEVIHFVISYWKDNFRPAFTSFCCEAVGGKIREVEDVSLMITLLSAGGGIHDDVLDKSSHKHFRKTVLGKYGLDSAILVGDLFILKGWMMARELIKKNFQPDKLEKIIEIFGKWTVDVTEAEFMETSCRKNLETELEQYQKILCKSMADTRACAKLGAIIGGGSKEEICALTRFGEKLGLIYRLIDDLKDTLNIEFNLHDRLQNESIPFPILYAAKKSKETKLIIKKIINKSKINYNELGNLLQLSFESKAFDYLYRKAKKINRDALDRLYCLRSTNSKDVLKFMIKNSLKEVAHLNLLADEYYQHGLLS